ncbi:MAG: putative rane protein [Deltaproteobacteria bacterium]|nr:putative rane protein [Deltaproteobacteria bacterium]
MKIDKEKSISRRSNGVFTYVLFIAAAIVLSWPYAAQGSDAKSILKAMSDYVNSQKAIEITFDSDIEVITPQLEKIQFTNSGDVLLSRPNKLRAHRVGGYADVALFFDGKTVSVYGKHINSYAQFDSPGTIDQLIEALRQGYGVALPGADLLLSNSYETLMADVKEARYIGRGVIDGRECEHLAFRNFDTDWQLWVEVGKSPIPRKLVITSKTLNNAPQYTLRVKSWKTGIEPMQNAFAFTPPAKAKKLGPDALIDLDELPQSK